MPVTAPTKRPRRGGATPAPEGIVTAIVAVTGTVDSVNDLIVPGAFRDTLAQRRPKVCYMHEWKDPIGRVLHIEELRPGDKRLPRKLPDGRPWPTAAGAVVATMQFHMNTHRGREMYGHASQWAINGEAAFSIGYKVKPGMSAKRGDGVRVIYALDLYEVSLVLFGAHDMALALEVKDAQVKLETKTAELPATETTQPDFTDHAMVALYPDADTAAALAHPDGLPADDLHITLAYLGEADGIDGETLAGALAEATAGVGPLEGRIGGLGIFPEGENGTPVWAPVDVPGLEKLRAAVVDACEAAGHPHQSEHGFTPHMTLGYNLPSVAPTDPTPVRFDQAVLVVGGQRYPLPLAAPAMETKHAAEAVALAVKSSTPPLGVAAQIVAAAAALPTAQETKSMMHPFRGSHEARLEAIRQAVQDLFRKPGKGDGDPMDASPCHTSVEATYDTHVIVCHHEDGKDTHYQVPYTVGEDGQTIELGKPSEVEVTVTIEATGEPATAEDVAQARFVLPTVQMLRDAASLIAAAPEGKALADELVPAVEAFLDQLAAKNLPAYERVDDEDDDWSGLADDLDDLDGDDLEDDEDLGDDEDLDADDMDDLEDDDLDADDMDEPDDLEDEDDEDESITVDPEEIEADMASLRP